MTQERSQCPVCGDTTSTTIRERDYGEVMQVSCRVCGRLEITRTAADDLRGQAILSAWLRDKAEREEEVPKLNTTTLPRILESLPRYGPLEKQRLLLRALARRSKYPGDMVGVSSLMDYPLAWAEGEQEFVFYINALVARALIKAIGSFSAGAGTMMITPAGWEHLDSLEKEFADSEQVFVAMRFTDEYENAWQQGIRAAIVNAGFTPIRIDKVHHAERIDAKIISEIRRSRFLVADASEPNPGVYYEAGFAHGQGKTVLWTCREDCKDRLHFDTRQYSHILWSTPEELKERLYDLIFAVIGRRR